MMLVVCGGCWPMKVTTSPGASGTLVDGSGKPVEGAEVVMSTAPYTFPPTPLVQERGARLITDADRLPPTMGDINAGLRPPRVVTDSSGRFSIPPKRRWILYVVPMEDSPSEGTLLIRRPGYQDRIMRVHSWKTEELGNVMVE
jgi:hypothetical protein